MNGPAKFLTVEEIISINRRTIVQHGGTFGVRDYNLLESAAALPMQSAFGFDFHPTIAHKAAAYLFHLCQNHPFFDGNKRTALVAAAEFLLRNGYDTILTNEEAELITLAVAAGEMSKVDLTTIFVASLIPEKHVG